MYLFMFLAFVVGAVAGFVVGYLVRRNNPADPVKYN